MAPLVATSSVSQSPSADTKTSASTIASISTNDAASKTKPKKKKVVKESESIPTLPTVTSATTNNKKKKDVPGGGNSLVICRNKHWKYISSFHGPWLQLPPEVLESLAYHNYATARPHPIDPAVFFDLVKIRRLVDDATNISVRAASGVASSSMANSYLPSIHGSNASILGIGLSSPGSQAKLSRERKHRMRELATQKLARAYILDEIAASVATMQGASTLEDVAGLVLERSPNDADAKYVHFFHEKIPSRMLATTTSLQPLTDVIAEKPWDGAILRTRAVTKGFKDDYVGAASDLTAALKVCKTVHAHDNFSGQSPSAEVGLVMPRNNGTNNKGGGLRNGTGVWNGPIDEKVHPSSLEMQLLFHRAGTYLTIACQHAEPYMSMVNKMSSDGRTCSPDDNSASGSSTPTTQDGKAVDPNILSKQELEKKIVRTNAKRALRDYLKYLDHFDYTPGLPWAVTVDYQNNENEFNEEKGYSSKQYDTQSVIPSRKTSIHNTNRRTSIPPRGPVYSVSSLFTSPPSGLPPYPPNVSNSTNHNSPAIINSDSQQTDAMVMHSHEAITYHPLLTDALHSLLLCHTLIATSTKELQRHAFMVARLARVCDGYPIFLAARSPARADWIEILKRVGDWIHLGAPWESLCAPAPLPNTGPGTDSHERRYDARVPTDTNDTNSQTLIPQSNITSTSLSMLMAKGQDGVARESQQIPRRWAQEDGKEYPISTERASLIARYVKERLKRENSLVLAKEQADDV